MKKLLKQKKKIQKKRKKTNTLNNQYILKRQPCGCLFFVLNSVN